MKGLERRIADLEKIGESIGPATSGVVNMQPGESVDDAVLRARESGMTGGLLVVPGVTDPATWSAMVRKEGMKS